MYKKNLVFAAACAGMLLFGIVLISLGSILPAITTKFGLDAIAVGSLVSLLPIGILAGSLVFGPIVDRYGYKSLLIVCSLMVMIGLEGIAFSGGYFMLQASILLIGFGGGVINGGTNALVADITQDEKGANLSLLGVFFGIGALGMPLLIGLLSSLLSYESILAGVGLFVLLPVAFFWAISFPTPKQPQGFPIKKSFSLIKDSLLITFGFILFFQSGLEGIVNNWTTTYLEKVHFSSTEDALFALSYYGIGFTLARLVLGGLLKKLDSYKVLLASFLISFIGALVVSNAGNYTMAITGLGLVSFGLAGGFPIILGYVGNIYAQLSGTAFSIVLVIALTGNTVLNYLTGVIAQKYGIREFTTVFIAGLIIMAILFGIAHTRMQEKTKI